MSRTIRGKTCPHAMGKLFVYHGEIAGKAWWCSICDSDLYEDEARILGHKPELLEESWWKS